MRDPKRMRRVRRSCSMSEVVSRASGGRAMVEQDRARGRAEAWRPWVAPWAAAGRRPVLAWPDGLSDFAGRAAERVHAWVTVEVGPGRLVPWLAIAFGCGIAIYFAVDREPAPWAAGLLLAATVAATVLARRRPFAFPLALGAAALAAGLATATTKRAIIAHPRALGAGLECRYRGLRRDPGRARALGPHRRAGRAHCRSTA